MDVGVGNERGQSERPRSVLRRSFKGIHILRPFQCSPRVAAAVGTRHCKVLTIALLNMADILGRIIVQVSAFCYRQIAHCSLPLHRDAHGRDDRSLKYSCTIAITHRGNILIISLVQK